MFCSQHIHFTYRRFISLHLAPCLIHKVKVNRLLNRQPDASMKNDKMKMNMFVNSIVKWKSFNAKVVVVRAFSMKFVLLVELELTHASQTELNPPLLSTSQPRVLNLQAATEYRLEKNVLSENIELRTEL